MERFDAIIGNFHLVTEGQKLLVTHGFLLFFLFSFSQSLYFLRIRASPNGYDEFIECGRGG